MKTRILYPFLVLSLILSACGGGSVFDQNRDKWEAQHISHYRFTVAVSCFCPFAGVDVTYEVQDGQIVNRTIQSTFNQEISEAQVDDFYQPYNTIEKVFEYVEGAIKEADETTIEYDSTYGFPTSVSVDWIKQAVDDEMYLTIDQFEPLL